MIFLKVKFQCLQETRIFDTQNSNFFTKTPILPTFIGQSPRSLSPPRPAPQGSACGPARSPRGAGRAAGRGRLARPAGISSGSPLGYIDLGLATDRSNVPSHWFYRIDTKQSRHWDSSQLIPLTEKSRETSRTTMCGSPLGYIDLGLATDRSNLMEHWFYRIDTKQSRHWDSSQLIPLTKNVSFQNVSVCNKLYPNQPRFKMSLFVTNYIPTPLDQKRFEQYSLNFQKYRKLWIFNR